MMTLTVLIRNAMWTSINVDWTPSAQHGPTAARPHLVLVEREIVISTQIVKEHCSVAMTIVQVDQQEWTAAFPHVIATLTALIKNAMWTLIYVDWILTALIGQSVARPHLVLMGREIVIITQIVRENSSVAMIIVQVDLQGWTAAHAHAKAILIV